jgi:hypothetical protein
MLQAVFIQVHNLCADDISGLSLFSLEKLSFTSQNLSFISHQIFLILVAISSHNHSLFISCIHNSG